MNAYDQFRDWREPEATREVRSTVSQYNVQKEHEERQKREWTGWRGFRQWFTGKSR